MPRPLFHGWRLAVQRRVRRAGGEPATGQGFRGAAGWRGRARAVAAAACPPNPETLLAIVFHGGVSPSLDGFQLAIGTCRTPGHILRSAATA